MQYGNFFCLPDELPTAQMLFHILRFHYAAVNSPNFYHKARWVFLVPNLLTSWRTRKRFWAAIEWCNIWYNSDLYWNTVMNNKNEQPTFRTSGKTVVQAWSSDSAVWFVIASRISFEAPCKSKRFHIILVSNISIIILSQLQPNWSYCFEFTFITCKIF